MVQCKEISWDGGFINYHEFLSKEGTRATQLRWTVLEEFPAENWGEHVVD